MTHDEPASETQHQYDDGEYHSCSIGSVLHILLRGALNWKNTLNGRVAACWFSP